MIGELLCDLKKVFNCVNYGILLPKMKFYIIVCVAHKLMECYLRNRYQKLTINACNKINGYFSKWEEVQHGVPQGSVVWIIIVFNIY